jgi:Na+/H+-dicarboxylate symporter
MGLAFRILSALLLGLAAGALLQSINPTLANSAVAGGRLIGGLWINALRMTIIPLVLSLVVTGVASAIAAAHAGALTSRAISIFLVFLVAAGCLGLATMIVLLQLWGPDPAAVKVFIHGLSSTHPNVPPQPASTELLQNIIPSNPVEAAAKGSILPFVVFALFLGFSIGGLKEDIRKLLTKIFEGVAAAMLRIVSWVLIVAPLGVFALALTLSSTDVRAFGVLLNYLLLVCAAGVVGTIAAYIVALVATPARFLTFVRAAAPAQVVAISTQSSLASLPAMLKGAQEMGVRQEVAALTLPLAVSMFRFTNPLVNTAVAVYSAHLYGVPLIAGAAALAVLTAVLTNFSSVGVSSQVSFFVTLVPVFAALGVPFEILAVLIAIETIPDMFRTLGNVSMDLSVAAVVNQSVHAHSKLSGDIAAAERERPA